jgi:hypothetical protein
MQNPAKVELQWWGRVWRGVVVGGLGVLTSDDGRTYAGGVTGGVPDGRGVIKRSGAHTSFGTTSCCELAAGEFHGYREVHWANGDVGYSLHERGLPVHDARVVADGNCSYDNEPCRADHAGLVALTAAAQQAAVRPPPSPRRSPSDRAPLWVFVRVMHVRVPRSAVAFLHW